MTEAPSLVCPPEQVDSDDRGAQALEGAADPLIGTEIGRYRLTRLLGEGGMGRVYLACQPTIGSRVAVKILLDDSARNPELVERFFAEARAVNLVNHEHIVNIIDLAQLPDGRSYIVMEYIEGETLSDLASAGPVPLGGLVQIMREVLSALGAAHAIGIVHRDVKPENVRVTAEGHAKVLDFGVAKLAPALQRQVSPRTRTGALLGTPHYMAPEQISGTRTVDARTDLYATGVMLYELATGRKPFHGETLFDLMRAHLEEAPPPLRAQRPEVPPAMERVILKALAKQPDDRFASAAEMSEALRQAATALPSEEWCPLARAPSRPLGSPGPEAGSAPGAPYVPARGSTGRAVAPPSRAAIGSGIERPATASSTTAAADSTQAMPAASTPRRARWLVGGGILVAVATAGGWAFVGHRDATTVHTSEVAAGALVAAPASAAPEAPPARRAAVPEAAITVQLEIDPLGAAVTLDGRPIHGRELTVARDGERHALRITAAGHATVEQIVRFDQSQRVVVQLKPAATTPRGAEVRHERIEVQSPYE